MLHHLQNLFQALDFRSLGDAALRVAAVFLCLTIHETCHGLAAYVMGDPTAKSMHRLSLNPLRHIDWLGLAMMFVAGFGWAKPVPVDPRYFRKPKQGMAVTALAGPASNLLLALLAMLISSLIYHYAPYSAAMDVFSTSACLNWHRCPLVWACSTCFPSRRWMAPRYWQPCCQIGLISD